MIPAPRRARWAAFLAASLLLAGCGDDGSGPVDEYDAEPTLDQLSQVVDPLNASGDALLGLEAGRVALFEFSGFAAAAMLDVARPDLGVDVQAVRRLRAARARWGAELVMPSAIRGETLVWDVADDRYEVDESATGAPANGVRIILYQMGNDASPIEPLQELGYMELTDEDLLNTERLGILVVNTEGTTDVELLAYYIDFDETGTQTEGSMRFDARGSLSDGTETLDFDLSQAFTWSEAADQETLLLDYEYQHEDEEVLFRLETSMPFEGGAWGALALNVELQGGAGDAVIAADMDASGRIDGTIERNGRLVMRITGVDPDPIFTRPNGERATGLQLQALAEVWEGVVSLLTLTEWLIGPGLVLLLPN